MPAILLEEHHDGWTGKAGKEILVPPGRPDESMADKCKGKLAENNNPDIIVPIELESVARPENSGPRACVEICKKIR